MKKNKDIIIIGFALFSMFFGAGNLIFPPFIGMTSGSDWLTSFLGFVLADVGIILLSINAVAKSGSFQNVVGKAGKNFGITLEVIMMLCLGPILVIPRTAATTFEMSITPLTSSVNSIIFSILFFGLTFILTIRPTKVMDIIGKFLTPILLLALGILITKGVVSPIGKLSNNDSDGLFVNGLTQGYQTMDALGIGGVTALIMTSFISKGYTDKKENISMTLKSALIAGSGLVIVYGGLAYLGATVSTMYDTSISQTALLVNITNSLLGKSGIILLGIIVAFACLTTSIGLTSVTAKYFEDVTNKKLKYTHLVAFICIFSSIASNLGVDRIIAIAAPILTIIYPVSILLVLMSTFNKYFTKPAVFKCSAYATLLISLLNVVDSLGLNINFVHKLPLDSIGFNWVIPAIIGGFIGKLMIKDKNKQENLNKISA
ncbi:MULTISPECIES: branched-chain amino acid transport system II carrier protein [Terrisporobacter]|mgnify:FL=1|uniref:branched-chain amino acid transport system II carrier protein n=1 Tax=Terrisporobacter TaxID=1505652 RepID=UPI002658B99A|nr:MULTISPECIES: branched-chain amino acid transport system II carrier protein [Terrisporobacter]MCC3670062.1 branched-chain amino acid transport system II carrier protein [Terrisporobacter mayombei]MDU6983365.1 branched-chain amino acid transport system II carrier protein [Terrisporobacter othiniensis]